MATSSRHFSSLQPGLASPTASLGLPRPGWALALVLAGCTPSVAQPSGGFAAAAPPGFPTVAPPAASPQLPPGTGPAVFPLPLPDVPAPSVPADPPSLSAAATEAEITRLRADFAREVPSRLTTPAPGEALMPQRAAAVVAARGKLVIDRPQLAVVVDRNPRVQVLWLVVARPDAAWAVIGRSRISTGETNHFDHYITPVGVFLNTDAILGFRAQGTFNENHIRGYGVKGMRVWDFGWQSAEKGWRADRERGDIRLEMHATDPDRLERRLGRPDSQGCVRIPAALNRFFDRRGVIDRDYERAAVEDIRFRALLLPDRNPSPLAGRAMIVIDSALPLTTSPASGKVAGLP